MIRVSTNQLQETNLGQSGSYQVVSSSPSKDQNPTLRDIQGAIRELQRCLPHLELSQNDIKEYSQNIEQEGIALYDAAMSSKLKVSEAETNLKDTLRHCKSLFTQLQAYKSSGHQQKFEMTEYEPVLIKFENSTESLRKIERDLSQIQDIFHSLKFNRDSKKYIQGTFENDGQRDGQLNERERSSLKHCQEVSEKLEEWKGNYLIQLQKIRNFIKSIVQENSYVEEGLKRTNAELSDVEEDGIIDIIFEHYSNVVSMEKHQDAVNFKKIACYILQIKETEKEDLEALEFLVSILHANNFVRPSLSDDDRKNIICSALDHKYKFDLKELDDESEDLEEELENFMRKLETAEVDLRKVKKAISDAEDDEIPKREKEVNKLMIRINASKTVRDLPDQKNIQRNMDTDGDDDNDEEKLKVAKRKLLEVEKKVEDKESKKDSLKKDIEYLESQQKELKSKMSQMKKKKTKIERQKEDLKTKILNYHSCLKIGLMRGANKYVKETNFERIKAFEKSLTDNLIAPIQHFIFP